jgi:hypothetical protein
LIRDRDAQVPEADVLESTSNSSPTLHAEAAEIEIVFLSYRADRRVKEPGGAEIGRG